MSMTRDVLENAILYMINTYLESELISRKDVAIVLANMKMRAFAKEPLV